MSYTQQKRHILHFVLGLRIHMYKRYVRLFWLIYLIAMVDMCVPQNSILFSCLMHNKLKKPVDINIHDSSTLLYIFYLPLSSVYMGWQISIKSFSSLIIICTLYPSSFAHWKSRFKPYFYLRPFGRKNCKEASNSFWLLADCMADFSYVTPMTPTIQITVHNTSLLIHDLYHQMSFFIFTFGIRCHISRNRF